MWAAIRDEICSNDIYHYKQTSNISAREKRNLNLISASVLVLLSIPGTVCATSTGDSSKSGIEDQGGSSPYWVPRHLPNMISDYIFPTVLVLGTVLPYYPQYRTIQQERDARGFSTFVSMVLISSSLVRLFYWIGERFAMYLLIQAIATLIAQLLLLKLCVDVQNETNKKTGIKRTKPRQFLDFRLPEFWQWDNFSSYIQAVGTMTLILIVATLLFYPSSVFTQVLGAIGLGIEAMLAVPQLIRNFSNKSTKGLSLRSLSLIFAWLIGDGFKTFYFIYSKSPLPFILCGCFQLFIDALIFFQVFCLYD